MSLHCLLLHRPKIFKNPLLFSKILHHSTLPQNPTPKSNLSARLSFVFDQIDKIDNQTSEKFDTLQKIRQWRENRVKNEEKRYNLKDPNAKLENSEDQNANMENLGKKKKDVELVHPWPEWIELMERLAQQNYFDFGKRGEEDDVAESVGIDLSDVKEDVGFDFSRDWTTVRNGCMNFGKDRFDILRSLSKKDIQILVGHGCPSMDPKVVFSAKLLRKYTHLDEGDVCSSCSLRNSCSRGYILTLKEDEARTLDIMRILLTYGFDHVNGAVENKPLMQIKPVKTIVRKLLHEIVRLSAVPIDPNLPPPVIKKPPPKVKQPPPQPKKRVGRDDVEMKKGDWLCSKCDFMNFAKNTVCLQCDAKRPKRQLLPGEWECPQCNFLNYRRNMACFHCDAKRPPDEFTEDQFQEKQPCQRMRFVKGSGSGLGPTRAQDISNAWNFDFDDNESDGADVAAFEFADLNKGKRDASDLDDLPHERRDSMNFEARNSKTNERAGYFSGDNERNATMNSDRTGFDDFDDEEDDDDVDSYVLDGSNNSRDSDVSKRSFSKIENTSESEEFENFNHINKDYISDSEDDELANHPQLKASHVSDSWKKTKGRGRKSLVSDDEDDIELGSDYDDDDMDSDFESKQRKARHQSSGNKGISRRKGGSDSNSDLLPDTDSDGDDDMSYSRTKTRGTKGFSNRRGNDFKKSNDFDNHSRRGGFKSNNQNGYGGRREKIRFEHFDKFDNGTRRQDRSNQFGDRSRGSRRENKRFDDVDKFSNGNRRHDRSTQFNDRERGGSRRENNRFEDLDKFDYGNRRQNRSNQFNDGSRGGSRRDDRGSRRNDNDGRRGDDRFKRERTSNFRDRNQNFDNGIDSVRPRRVVVR